MATANRLLVVEALIVLAMVEVLAVNLEGASLTFHSRVWPLTILGLMGFVAVALLASAFIAKTQTNKESPYEGTRDEPLRRYGMMGLYAAFVLVLPIAGFALATMLFVPLASGILGMRLQIRSIALSLVVAIVIYIFFAVAFKVPLPEGVFGNVFSRW